MTTTKRWILVAASGLVTLGAGCSTDGADPGTNGDADSCQDGLYAIATSVPTGQDSSAMFVATHCGLGAGELSLDEALEFPGGGRIVWEPEPFRLPDQGAFLRPAKRQHHSLEPVHDENHGGHSTPLLP